MGGRDGSLQIPLVAHDAIFTNVKDLELLTRLGQ
jgi:hypothetical protein